MFWDWKPKGKRTPPVLNGTAQNWSSIYYTEVSTNHSVMRKPHSWSGTDWGGCPSTSTRARPWGTAGPSSGIWRRDSAFRFCCFKVSKQFWGGQFLLGLVLRKKPLEREEAMLGHGANHRWERWRRPPTTPDLTQRWRARGGVLPRNPLYFFWDWFLHMVRICFSTFWTSSSIWPCTAYRRCIL